MTYEMGNNPNATAAASALMVAALTDLLIQKGVLGRNEVAGAFQKAFDECATFGDPAIRIHGPQVVASVMRDLPTK